MDDYQDYAATIRDCAKGIYEQLELAYLQLDLTGADGRAIHDQYPVLVPVGYEGLLVGVGVQKTQLPFQSQPYIFTVLERSYG